MGRSGASAGDIELTGFLLGVVAGSAATLVLTNYYWRRREPPPPPPPYRGTTYGYSPRHNRKFNTKRTSFADNDVAFKESADEEENHVDNFAGEMNVNGTPLSSEEGHAHLARRPSNISVLSTDVSIASPPSLSHQSFTIGEEDVSSKGYSRSSSMKSSCYADNPESGTNYEVITEEDWAADTEIIQQAKDFDEQILSNLSSKEEMQVLLRRTRAVNTLAHALTLAEDERACYEQVSRLIVPLFRIDGCCFAMKKDDNNVIFKHLTAKKREYFARLGMESGADGLVMPLKETAAAFVAKTLKQYYCPRTRESPFEAQRMVWEKLGLNTMLVTPIMINGDKFAGCILAYLEREDGFGETDRMLIGNVAEMLGAAIYSKRLRLASEISNKISREMLHSMIPPKVIEKIECYWDETTDEYRSRRSSSFIDSWDGSIDTSDRMSLGDGFEMELNEDGGGSSNLSNQRGKKERRQQRRQNIRQSIKAKVDLLNDVNKSELELDNVGMVIDTSAIELTPTNRALYAETVPNVCIIFTDIVGFSEISLSMKPIKVMDMLQDLFSRFDALCGKYGVQKLETIGDAYICTTNLFDNDDECGSNNAKEDAAVSALAMAKDMVREARQVFLQKKNRINTLEIRVGIHIGEITCGVLGERLPKFTVFGNAVNLAARMEQTCIPSRIRVTKDFFDLLPESEDWEKTEKIAVKNMGEVVTYLSNPL